MGGFLAKKMGVPIGKIVCGTNSNDIVHRALSTGDMSFGENVPTVSPGSSRFHFLDKKATHGLTLSPVFSHGHSICVQFGAYALLHPG
jgi:hypothetical protein